MNNYKELFSLKGKVIIITGGGGFLGTQYARALSSAGAELIRWDVKASRGVDVVDITNEKEVQSAVRAILKKHGHIDALINNAAMNPAAGSEDAKRYSRPYEEYPIDLWEKELKTNLTGMMICTKAVTPGMIKKKNGAIINIASELSVIAHDHRVYADSTNKRFKSIAYTTTKSAILGFTRQWAARLGRYNVRVNSFSPVGMQMQGIPKDFIKRYGDTTMMGRMAKEDEYAGAIIFLCSDASLFMTGHNLIIDGGRSAW